MSWENLFFQLMALNALNHSDGSILVLAIPLADGSILVLAIPLEEINRQDVSHADNHHRKLASES